MSLEQEAVLTSEQIVALKEEFKASAPLLGIRVCFEIASAKMREKQDVENVTDHSINDAKTSTELLARLAASGGMVLGEALAMEGADWPVGSTGPELFARTLDELKAAEPTSFVGSLNG